MTIRLSDIPIISEGDIDDGAINYTRWLDAGEYLVSVDVDELTTSDLTITNMEVNDVPIYVKGKYVAENKAALFRVSGQEATQEHYCLEVTVTTSTGRVKKAIAKFEVEPAYVTC